MPFSTADFFYCKIVLAKGKKKVRSWKTGDGEDMALPVIQKKEKGFTKKTSPNHHQK